jgi:release factor glutamine methyltransferase
VTTSRNFHAELQALTARLAGAGFVSAAEEAIELLAAAGGSPDVLERLVQRRLTGEPLAWITGIAVFCGLVVRVAPGVYVPRRQSEPLAQRAAARLPAGGLAIDVCTGSGALARTLATFVPGARVVATDVDERAVACARSNGVDARCGDLFAPVAGLGADVVVGVVPYVPTPELPFLQRDTFTHERTLAYDGGPDGTALLQRVLDEAPLRAGGTIHLELGGDQADALDLGAYRDVVVHRDDEGDPRAIEAVRRSR